MRYIGKDKVTGKERSFLVWELRPFLLDRYAFEVLDRDAEVALGLVDPRTDAEKNAEKLKELYDEFIRIHETDFSMSDVWAGLTADEVDRDHSDFVARNNKALKELQDFYNLDTDGSFFDLSDYRDRTWFNKIPEFRPAE